jgi:hypothetical protein
MAERYEGLIRNLNDDIHRLLSDSDAYHSIMNGANIYRDGKVYAQVEMNSNTNRTVDREELLRLNKTLLDLKTRMSILERELKSKEN